MPLIATLTVVAALAQAHQPAGLPNHGHAKQTRHARATRTTSPINMDMLKQQVMLDRAGFSPGAIDGRGGSNTEGAQAAFKAHNTAPAPAVEPLSRYRITPEDTAGPFAPIPDDVGEKAKLPALGYTSVLEELAERFHATPALLKRLNPASAFAAGEEIQVPNVDPMLLPVDQPPRSADTKTSAAPGASKQRRTPASAPVPPAPAKQDVVVRVGKADRALTVTDPQGTVVFYAPVTTGSEHDPLPIGEWRINGVRRNPQFHYNPDLFWDADASRDKATLQPGPNNPVGVVWIDISKEHYGIHGTPEPEAIGRAASHGCVRLTNWDALRLATLVKPGTRVVFTE